MAKEILKFYNQPEQYEFISIRKTAPNILAIKLLREEDAEYLLEDMDNFSKIELYNRVGKKCGYYNNFSTLYRPYEGYGVILLSNDGSVYVEKVEEEIVPPIEGYPAEGPEQPPYEYVPYEPTLDEVRASKIVELSRICNTLIENGVDLEIDGEMEHFSYKIEDQTNIKDAFDLALQTGMNVPYHSVNCKLYTPEQIIELYIKQTMNKTHHTTYFNQMKMYILVEEDKEVIQNINYGDELQGEYLEKYNDMMAQAQAIVGKMTEMIAAQRGEEE